MEDSGIDSDQKPQPNDILLASNSNVSRFLKSQFTHDMSWWDDEWWDSYIMIYRYKWYVSCHIIIMRKSCDIIDIFITELELNQVNCIREIIL